MRCTALSPQATYSQMSDWREAAAAGGSSGGGAWRARVGGALAQLPSSASDMLIGAVAGAASVLLSMPCDVIKTRMDLGGGARAVGGGVLASTRAFFDTGRQLVRAGGGLQALFVGVAPRLLQTVPSTMVYWAAVEGTRRLMQQHCDIDGGPPSEDAAPRPMAAAVEAPVAMAASAPELALSSSSSDSDSESSSSVGLAPTASASSSSSSSVSSAGGGFVLMPVTPSPGLIALPGSLKPRIMPIPGMPVLA